MTMNTTCRTLSSSVRPAHLHEAPTAPSSYVIDFVAARDRLRTEIDEVSRQIENEQEVRKPAGQRNRAIELCDTGYAWLYSLIPADAIVALLVGVLGLLD